MMSTPPVAGCDYYAMIDHLQAETSLDVFT